MNFTDDFLTNYSDGRLSERVCEFVANLSKYSRNKSTLANYSAMIFGTSSIHLYASCSKLFELVDQVSMNQTSSQAMRHSQTGVQLFNAVVSSHLLDCSDPNEWLPQLADRVDSNGALFLSFFGARTAKTLIELIAKNDSMPHFQEYYSMQDVGDHLASLGFSDVVLESEFVDLKYNSIAKLIEDTKLIAWSNLNPARRKCLTPKGIYLSVVKELENHLDQFGELTINIELCYARGIKRTSDSARVAVPILQRNMHESRIRKSA